MLIILQYNSNKKNHIQQIIIFMPLIKSLDIYSISLTLGWAGTIPVLAWKCHKTGVTYVPIPEGIGQCIDMRLSLHATMGMESCAGLNCLDCTLSLNILPPSPSQ